jgi:putative nucleotidyltransferase with HDIG domain
MRISLIFLLFGTVWTLVTDHLIYQWVDDARMLMTIQHFKSGAFVIASTSLVAILSQRERRSCQRAADTLQKANQEILAAYDASIEGWSQALDLRDKETEGHSLRVTEAAMQLCQKMGMSGTELVTVRRGALLHDIGKMGVPDSILLKPGPLSDEEWTVMKMHPTYAHELLSPITFLNSALDIPYCHHERWDGSGYPRGLRGEQIPLAARSFAVIDVWDALTHDRPYRAALPVESARNYLVREAGAHFDPSVVEVFLTLLGLEKPQDPKEPTASTPTLLGPDPRCPVTPVDVAHAIEP